MAVNLKLEVYELTYNTTSGYTLDMLGILEVCKSIIWEEQAYGAGSFTLESILTSETATLLKRDHIIWIEGYTAGIIESIDATAGEDGVNITVKGRTLTSILDRRVIWGGTSRKYGPPGAVMYSYVYDNLVPSGARQMPCFGIMSYSNSGSSIRVQRTGSNILELQEELGEAYGISFGVRFNPSWPRMEYWNRAGVDRTIHQQSVDPVFFSTELDDVISSEYSLDTSDMRTCVVIGGQVDEDTGSRTYVRIEGAETGMDRRELFVDARDLGQDAETTDDEYKAILQNRGYEKLGECQEKESFEVQARTRDTSYEYGTDFFLGDKITITDDRLGVSIDAIVTAVQRSITREGESLSFTFGYDVPTVYDKLRKVVG